LGELMDLPYTLDIERWETPATNYPLASLYSAEITRRRQSKGLYRMEGVRGFLYYRVRTPINVTYLKIRGRVVMLDDPLHWYGMVELAKHSNGKVLVGGLGLGLVVHGLLENSKVDEIDVVEINPDVIKLIQPLLPQSQRVSIHEQNVFVFDIEKDYRTVILDLWVGEGTREVSRQMLSAFATFKVRYPRANVYIWGHGSPSLNPSVDPNVRKKIPRDYWRYK